MKIGSPASVDWWLEALVAHEPAASDDGSYETGIEVLHGAIQQMGLVPLEDMEGFLEETIKTMMPDSELSRRKVRAARRQLRLIAVSRRYVSEIRAILAD
ncbi:MAG TPA: hypothetical protein VJP78_06385 [Thermoleophilia bacterium]|nr:hypothetical protein [Thermoleophilia bacterium]